MSEAIRSRYVTAAARLFAERGYAGTSVADIQTTLGLTPGSGALYKHFASKRALLEAVVELHLSTMRAGHELFASSVPDEVEPALRFVAEAVWSALARDRDALRVALRDLDRHPDLLTRVWDDVRTHVYEPFAAWVREQAERGTAAVADPDATATVLLAALTYRPILDALIARVPGDVGRERYLEAWVRLATATLAPPAPGPAGNADAT